MRLAHVLARSMMMSSLALGAAAISTGCASKTEAERTADQADDIQKAADMMARGEAMQKDGAEMVARGETMKRQGDTSGGDRVIAEGRAKGRAGDALVEQGRALRNKAKL